MIRSADALIIGAGPSGLAVAYALQGDTLVLEKESKVGGLCRSFEYRGGVFDIGGHSFHTPHPEVYELVNHLLGGRLFKQQRDARVFSNGTLIPYPFQKYFDRIPDPRVVKECEEGLRNSGGDSRPPPHNFEEYIVHKFGQGIADHFMLPYNRKLWAREISELSCDWTSERVAGAKGESERFDATSGKRKPLQADTVVAYPAAGGFEEIYRSFLPHIPALELDSELVQIDPQKRIAVTSDGRLYRWRFLVSTIPLPVLTRVVDTTPEEIRQMAARLEYLSLRVDFLLTAHPLDTPIQRIYVADPEIPPHKIALNHNSSDHLRELPRHAIMAEMSVSAQKPIDRQNATTRTIDFLCDVGVLDSRAEICWTGHLDVEYGYPVYTHERAALVEGIREWLEKHDIYTLGRFGDWEYVNSDSCVIKGLSLGRKLRETYLDGELSRSEHVTEPRS